MIDSSASSRARGHHIEAVVQRFLATQGLTPLQRNFTRRVGEIDLVLLDPDQSTHVLVEVRYRQRGTSQFGTALESITMAKRRRLMRAAGFYLQQVSQRQPEPAVRFDVVGVSRDTESDDADGRLTPASAVLLGNELLENPRQRFDGYQLQWVRGALSQDSA